jgi:hypothetical protein
MAVTKPSLSIITLNVKKLKRPMKRYGVIKWI